jgi:5-methyltetrahydrofolate--homocysteine methyltransferase
MPIEFDPDRWTRVKRDAAQWWAGRLDRPLIQMRLWGRDPGRPESSLGKINFRTPYDLSVTPDAIVDRWDYELSCTEYLGDAFPCVWPNMGPGVLATALGAEAEPHDHTTWFYPPTQQDIADIRFRYNPLSRWMQRVKALGSAAMARLGGRAQVAMTDLGGNLDVVSTFRPAEKLLFDLYDHPEEVKRLVWEGHESWWQAFDDLNAVLRPANPGYTSWASVFSESPFYMLQCDFCYMIGPEMFDEFVKPELSASCRKLANAFYHLDGPGQLPHLDSLLTIRELRGVQWVPGAGQKPQQDWPDVYRRIRAAGKLVQIYDDANLTALTALAEQLGSVAGFVAIANGRTGDREKAVAALRRFGVETWS